MNSAPKTFLEAVERGLSEIAEDFICSGSFVDEFFDVRGRQMTPLMVAAELGNTYTLNMLIARGADVDLKNNLGITALMFGAAYGHCRVIENLIKAGVDVDATDNEGHGALYAAQINGYDTAADMLKRARRDDAWKKAKIEKEIKAAANLKKDTSPALHKPMRAPRAFSF